MFDYYNILLPTPLHITQAEVPCLSFSVGTSAALDS